MDTPAAILAFLQSLPLQELSPYQVADKLAEQGGPAFSSDEMRNFLKRHNLHTALYRTATNRHYTPQERETLVNLLNQRPLLPYVSIRRHMHQEHNLKPIHSTILKYDDHSDERLRSGKKGSTWQPEITAEMNRLKQKGLSASKIAKRLTQTFTSPGNGKSFTRNAVIGQLHRQATRQAEENARTEGERE